MANNITEVRLMNVPLENDYKHTIYFESKTAQESYFKGKSTNVSTFNNLSYQRKDGFIRIPKKFDDVCGKYNYVMYQNPAYSNKWFYAFITKFEFKSDGLTDIYIETDVIQTWLFDYRVLPSFIEREHVDDDTIGLHTVPEQLEHGEYTCYLNVSDESITAGAIGYVIGSTVDLSGADEELTTEQAKALSWENVGGSIYGKVYSGIKYFFYSASQSSKVNNVLTNLAKAGKSDAVTCLFMCPWVFLNISDDGEVVSVKTDGFKWSNTGNTPIIKPSGCGAYGPRNNKLLSYPYRYLLMSNNSGSSAVYHYELFNSDNCDFQIDGVITPGFSCRIKPLKYNGVEENNEEGLTLGKYPICNWNTDVYTNWLTQNSVNIATSLGAGAIGTVASALTLQGDGVMAGLMGIANTMGEIYSHSLQPPQAEGNINSGDVNFATGNLTFTAYHMTIKEEYAKMIDGFFDMFGYKVNMVKTPNVNHRSKWWYTKTIDVSIDGAIPMDDMSKIKECYNKGITFWKDTANIGNYSLRNLIV